VSFLSFRVRDLNPIDSLGYSALARCTLNYQFEAAFKLLSRGANIDIQNFDGRTALTLMIIEENV
jgi:ankyrin repeat protein